MSRPDGWLAGAALAEHIGQSKLARLQQESVNLAFLDTQTSARRKEITAWLAPASYDVGYYSNDLANAKALRFSGSCRWILDKEAFKTFSDTSSEESLLWVYAKPGAGKTIVSSFLIEHYSSQHRGTEPPNVFYFFCKNTDVDKNTPTAVARSLLYQLFNSAKSQGLQEALNNDLGKALDSSGQQRAVNFTTIWQIFSSHVIGLLSVIIILDALDECQEPDILIQSVKTLSTKSHIEVIVTSRKEARLDKQLSDSLTVEITPEDLDTDVAAFVNSKVAASPRLSHPSVREIVINRLSHAHGGMFLWIYLMLKELKSCISVSQVQEALTRLPKGLDGVYGNIL